MIYVDAKYDGLESYTTQTGEVRTTHYFKLATEDNQREVLTADRDADVPRDLKDGDPVQLGLSFSTRQAVSRAGKNYPVVAVSVSTVRKASSSVRAAS